MPRKTPEYDNIPKEDRYREIVRAIEKAHYLARTENHAFLVYLLGMARTEAANLSPDEDS